MRTTTSTNRPASNHSGSNARGSSPPGATNASARPWKYLPSISPRGPFSVPVVPLSSASAQRIETSAPRPPDTTSRGNAQTYSSRSTITRWAERAGTTTGAPPSSGPRHAAASAASDSAVRTGSFPKSASAPAGAPALLSGTAAAKRTAPRRGKDWRISGSVPGVRLCQSSMSFGAARKRVARPFSAAGAQPSPSPRSKPQACARPSSRVRAPTAR